MIDLILLGALRLSVLVPGAAEYFSEHFCDAHTCNRKEQLARLETVAQVCLACFDLTAFFAYTPAPLKQQHQMSLTHTGTLVLRWRAVERQYVRQQSLWHIHAHLSPD